MIQALIGQKIDQTQKFLENGRRIPVTEIAVMDNTVLQVKTAEKDSYTAVQLGFGTKRRANKAALGHAKKANITTAPVVVREVAIAVSDTVELPKPGDAIAVDAVFKPGDIVDISGTSKGKGFAGVVKRHNFRGGPKTHGQSDRHRAPGSIGQTTTPGRVYKGKRMAGHMGVDTVTIRNLTIVDVDAVNKKLLVLGLVPGHKNAILCITWRGENKKFVPLLRTKEEIEAQKQEEAPQTVVEAAAQLEEAATNEAAADEPATEEVQVSEEPKEELVKEVASNTEEGEEKAASSEEKEEEKKK